MADDAGISPECDFPDGLVVAGDRVGEREAGSLAGRLDRHRPCERSDLGEPSRDVLGFESPVLPEPDGQLICPASPDTETIESGWLDFTPAPDQL